MVNKSIKKLIYKYKITVIESGINVEKVILYGSYASGKNYRDSDVDIAVISSDFGKDRIEEGVNLLNIASKIDSRIEPIPISTESFFNDTWLPLIYEIRTTGIEF